MVFSSFHRTTSTLLVASSIFLGMLATSLNCIAEEIRVAAASSLSFALEDLKTQYERKHSHELKISLAASGTLARQIAHGAPFDLFLSADAEAIEFLITSKVITNSGQIYAYGDLIYFSPKPFPLLTALKEKQRISLANPNTAPYGKMAKIHLQKLNYLKEDQNTSDHTFIIGESAAQAARFATSSAVAGALIPRSLAIKLVERNQGRIFELEPKPKELAHHMVLIPQPEKDPNLNQTFFDFILSTEGQKIFQEHGFLSFQTTEKIMEN